MTGLDWLSLQDVFQALRVLRDGDRLPSERKLRLFLLAVFRKKLSMRRWSYDVGVRYQLLRILEEGEERADGQGVRISRISGQADYLCQLIVEAAEFGGIPADTGAVRRSERRAVEQILASLGAFQDNIGGLEWAMDLFREVYNPFFVGQYHATCATCNGTGLRHGLAWPVANYAFGERPLCLACGGRKTLIHDGLNPLWLTRDVREIADVLYRDRESCDQCGGFGQIQPGPQLCHGCAGRKVVPTGQLDNSALKILADALEEAGMCNDAPCVTHPILAHLREDFVHVRGCWALDWVRGQSWRRV